MSDFKFYMKRVFGKTAESRTYDLEKDFPGLRYKSLTGANVYGKPSNNYQETFAEDDKALVYVGSDDIRSQTDLTLTLYFFDPNKAAGTVGTETPYSRMSALYHQFVEFFSGCKIIYHDTARNRYVYAYIAEAPTVSKDQLLNLQYMEVQFKLKNIYGRTFDQESDITL